MEKRLDSPHVKEYSSSLGDVGVELNSLGLCLFPAYILKQKRGFDIFFEENQISDCSQKYLNWYYQQTRNYILNVEEHKIPKKQHYVWITREESPRELFADKEQISFAETNLQTFANLQGWDHYLWTNDKKLIPNTVKWAED